MRRGIFLLTVMAVTLVVASGVALAAVVNCTAGQPCLGTNKDDTLRGTEEPDEMNAKQGDDWLFGLAGADFMLGDDLVPLAETVTDGNDKLYGHKGEDELVGFGGNDVLDGGGSADDIDAVERSLNQGEDTVSGGSGSDVILAADGRRDVINCGSGRDTITVDKNLDEVANCERINPRAAVTQSVSREAIALRRSVGGE